MPVAAWTGPPQISGSAVGDLLCKSVLPLQVLASIGQLEFFYDQAPDVMRSCSMALQLLSVCIGSYLSGALVAAISSLTYHMGCNWLPQDLNYGRLDLFFLLLAGEEAIPSHKAMPLLFCYKGAYTGLQLGSIERSTMHAALCCPDQPMPCALVRCSDAVSGWKSLREQACRAEALTCETVQYASCDSYHTWCSSICTSHLTPGKLDKASNAWQG